jgi:hypothetical protein
MSLRDSFATAPVPAKMAATMAVLTREMLAVEEGVGLAAAATTFCMGYCREAAVLTRFATSEAAAARCPDSVAARGVVVVVAAAG